MCFKSDVKVRKPMSLLQANLNGLVDYVLGCILEAFISEY